MMLDKPTSIIVSTGSISKRRIGNSLSKVGEVYGVIWANGREA